jgi:hypothetical protein
MAVQPDHCHSDDSLIVSAINMGNSLKHVVVAEGIETQEQRAYLQTQVMETEKSIVTRVKTVHATGTPDGTPTKNTKLGQRSNYHTHTTN